MGLRLGMLALAVVGCTTPFPIELLDAAVDAGAPRDSSIDARAQLDAARDGASLDGGGAPIVIDVSAGRDHTCLMSADAVYCFGANGSGQLGDGTHTPRGTPAAVRNLTGPLRTVSAGEEHTCVLDDAGEVHCWGNNGWDGVSRMQYRLGDGVDLVDNPVPVRVAGISGATDLAAGLWHSCALVGTDVRCWGQNASGELGVGDQDPHTTSPVTAALAAAEGVSAGMGVGCGIATASRELRCWGYSLNGEAGSPPNSNHLTAVAVMRTAGGTLTDVAQLDHDGFGMPDFEGHGCAATESGELYCWGFNGAGELGVGGSTPSSTATQVAGIADAEEVAAGARHTCIRTATGDVRCWGLNDHGQLGYGDTTPRDVPGSAIAFDPPRVIVAITAGAHHTCAVDQGGAVLCWGSNLTQQLGSAGGDAFSPRPVEWP